MVQRDDTLGGSRSAAPSPSTSDLDTPNATSSFGTEPAGSYGTVGAPPEPHRTEGAGQSAREQVRSLASEARDQAKRQVGEARDQVGQLVGQQKTRAAERLTGLAGALRQAAGNLQEGEGEGAGIGRVADNAAGQIDRLAGYLRDRELSDLVGDAENMARRHPDVFLGATFLSGLLLARFLKSSADRGYEGDAAYAGAYGTGSYGTGSYDTGSYGSGSYEAGTYGTGSYDTGAGSYGTGTGSYSGGTGSSGQGAGSGSWGTGGSGAGTTDAGATGTGATGTTGTGATGTTGTGATGTWGTEAGSPIHTYNNATVDTGSSSDPAYNTSLDKPATGAATDATAGSTGKTGKQRGGV